MGKGLLANPALVLPPSLVDVLLVGLEVVREGELALANGALVISDVAVDHLDVALQVGVAAVPEKFWSEFSP